MKDLSDARPSEVLVAHGKTTKVDGKIFRTKKIDRIYLYGVVSVNLNRISHRSCLTEIERGVLYWHFFGGEKKHQLDDSYLAQFGRHLATCEICVSEMLKLPNFVALADWETLGQEPDDDIHQSFSAEEHRFDQFIPSHVLANQIRYGDCRDRFDINDD